MEKSVRKEAPTKLHFGHMWTPCGSHLGVTLGQVGPLAIHKYLTLEMGSLSEAASSTPKWPSKAPHRQVQVAGNTFWPTKTIE